jgi:glycosyltransferase involved in cell wall biosynthesis
LFQFEYVSFIVQALFMNKVVLIISPDPLYPIDWGTKRDIWGHVSFFNNEGCRVVFIECAWSIESKLTVDKDDIPINVSYHFINRKVEDWAMIEHPETILALQDAVDTYCPQIILCEYAHFSTLISQLDLKDTKVWFRSHNFELLHMVERSLAGMPWREFRSFKKAYLWGKKVVTNAIKRYRKERLMHEISERIFFISYNDLRYMKKIYKGNVKRDWVLPFVDSDVIPAKDEKTPLDILYVGIYYEGNEQTIMGANKLMNQIAPAVEKMMPGAFRFNIVGRGATKMYSAHASETIVIHDYVENLSALMQEMDMVVLPINIGWGCKIKMVEALAAGLPVVGSQMVFRGIKSTKGAYFICHTTRNYLNALGLLRNFEKRSSIGKTANEAYKSWVKEGEQIFRQAIKEEQEKSVTHSNCTEPPLHDY